MVNVFERKILHLIKNIMAKILRISCRCNCRHVSGLYTKKQRQHCHCDQDNPPLYNVAQITVRNADIDDLCHLQRDKYFHQYFKNNKNRSKKRLLPVFSDGFKKCLIHLFCFPPRSFLKYYETSATKSVCRLLHSPVGFLPAISPLSSESAPESSAVSLLPSQSGQFVSVWHPSLRFLS